MKTNEQAEIACSFFLLAPVTGPCQLSQVLMDNPDFFLYDIGITSKDSCIR